MDNYIQFTQYMSPDGRKVEQFVGVSEELSDLASQLEAAGCTFACEVLSTGHVALYLEKDDDDFLTELSDNSPEVHEKLEVLIRKGAKLLGIKASEEK